MSGGTELADALTREHHTIDIGIETFLDGLDIERDDAPLHAAMDALRRHIYLEEEFLFPPLRAGGMLMPILVMEREHGELWRAMNTLEHTLHAPGDPEALRDGCRSLLTLLESHNSKEEPVVYPRADADLTDAQQDQLAAFLESGTVPDGWVCAKALA